MGIKLGAIGRAPLNEKQVKDKIFGRCDLIRSLPGGWVINNRIQNQRATKDGAGGLPFAWPSLSIWLFCGT